MNNDDRKFSNNFSQPSSEPANRQVNEVVANKRDPNWRTLGATMIVVVLLIGVASYISLTRHQPSPTVTPRLLTPTRTLPVSPTPESELPMLYPYLQWNPPEHGNFLFPIKNPPYSVELEGYYVKSAVTQTYPNDFLNYYQRELSARGWQQTEVADGPDGEWYEYQRGSRHFSTGIKRVSTEKYQAIVQYSK